MISFRAMFKMKTVLSIILFTILNFAKINGAVEILTRSEQAHPDWQFGFRITSFENGRLLYTLCNNKEDKKNCTIVQENLLSGITTNSCNITLNPEQNNARPGKFLVRSFGKDKAIFVWEEKGDETFVKIVTINLTCCKSNELKIRDTNKMQLIEPIAYQLYTSFKIAVYEDYYDVFFKDFKRCGNRECKVSIDAEGNFIEKSSFVSTTQYQMAIVLQPIAKRTANLGFVCVKLNWNSTSFSLVRPNGVEKALGMIDDNSNQIAGVVVDREIVGICILAERELKITCLQYDYDGNIKLKADINEITPHTHMISAHILRQGGFLLMFYQTEEQSSDCTNVSLYWIVKVDATGKIVGHFKFKGFIPTSIAQRVGFMYENPKGKGHCATIVYSECDMKKKKKRVNDRHVITNCFDEADLI